MLILAQSDALAGKALDAVTSAIQGGLLGVAVILAVAVIFMAITIGMSNRASYHHMTAMINFNSRLVTSLEKMDATLDKMSTQIGEIPKSTTIILEQINLIRRDFNDYTRQVDGTVAGVQRDMQAQMATIDQTLGEIKGKLKKIKPDTQPIPTQETAAPSTLPENPKPGEL